MNIQKITQLRRLSGYTQQQMADRMNKSLSSYNRLERGETAMTIDDMEKISEILQVPLAELLLNYKPQNIEKEPEVLNTDRIEKLFEEIHEIKLILSGIQNPAA